MKNQGLVKDGLYPGGCFIQVVKTMKKVVYFGDPEIDMDGDDEMDDEDDEDNEEMDDEEVDDEEDYKIEEDEDEDEDDEGAKYDCVGVWLGNQVCEYDTETL